MGSPQLGIFGLQRERTAVLPAPKGAANQIAEVTFRYLPYTAVREANNGKAVPLTRYIRTPHRW